MIELHDHELIGHNRQSSKGDQLKWLHEGFWYKADYLGYEGYSEYICSAMLHHSSLSPEEFADYETVRIKYGRQEFNGCKSRDFLRPGWQLITLERLFANQYGKSFYLSLFGIDGIRERVRFLVGQTEMLTGIRDFGTYLCKMLAIDALFLNEDRHLHNIAVLMDPAGRFHLCPFFDHGAGLLSDTRIDYPLHDDIYALAGSVKAKTVCDSFEEALDAAEELYGHHMTFSYSEKDIDAAQECDAYYDEDIKKRVKGILLESRRKYRYLFDK